MPFRNEDFARKVWLISGTEAIILHDRTKSLLDRQQESLEPGEPVLQTDNGNPGKRDDSLKLQKLTACTDFLKSKFELRSRKAALALCKKRRSKSKYLNEIQLRSTTPCRPEMSGGA
jgi:hypothetical protein